MLADGSKYVGEWYQGKQHGLGMIQDEHGVERQARWENGVVAEWISAR